ncbi:predicted protein [Sclerotinia sclerotiorum 1980 UF-70]|uniref:Uncharacterized protein n=1 Tax=Sclerotinia sclerotiorum (strain ATCC 18683 / 1980 / Ss-1) TaxID=665079 RepID=A7EUS5_SCLS1|nr:predicted protein [Sclerotinia sclerotiorum 1980 UF-70]EDN93217.1 predicted protein [Sclerotinia sclerotiorum 1980 UF-70]
MDGGITSLLQDRNHKATATATTTIQVLHHYSSHKKQITVYNLTSAGNGYAGVHIKDLDNYSKYRTLPPTTSMIQYSDDMIRFN